MKRLVFVFTVLAVLICVQMPAAAGESAVLEGEEAWRAAKKDALLSMLYEAEAASVREIIGLGLVSCEEVTEYYLERIEAYNETYNCFITICSDAVEMAVERDRQLAAGDGGGTLFGVPVVIKDNMDLAGYPTTNGHTIEASPVAGTNAEVVEALLAEGAVIVGKTNMSTDAEDARASESEAVGETKNAYNTLLASGGSSGGTAVAVSLNFAAAGLGTDTNSSLRIPAALNGCVSLRGTFGLISSEGCVSLNSTRDVSGAITRSVADQALLLDVMTDDKYRFAENLDGDALAGARLGILSELSYPLEGSSERSADAMDDEVLEAFGQAVGELEDCGAQVKQVSFPKIFALSEATFDSNADYLKERLYDAFREMVEENGLDAVIFPTYLTAPVKSGIDEDGTLWDAWAQPVLNNCPVLSPSAALPEISIPIGNHSLGAAIGMEIAALKGDEQLLLNLAYSYMERYDHRQAPEDTPDLHGGGADASLDVVLLGTVQAMDAIGRQFGNAAEPISPVWTAFLRAAWTLLAGVLLIWMAWVFQKSEMPHDPWTARRPSSWRDQAA